MEQTLLIWKFILLLSLFTLITPSTQTITFVENFCTEDVGYYTQNSVYDTILRTALKQLSAASSRSRFFNTTTFGSINDKVYAMYNCRYDLSSKVCRTCVRNATEKILQVCPEQKEAIIWYQECTLRYANRPIFAKMEVSPRSLYFSFENVTNQDQLNQSLAIEVNGLINQATHSYRSTKTKLNFGTGARNLTDIGTLLSLVQCTPDITAAECTACLQSALNKTLSCCGGAHWALTFLPSCELMFVVVPSELASPAPLPQLLAPIPSPLSTPSPVSDQPMTPPTNSLTTKANSNDGRRSTSYSIPAVGMLVMSLMLVIFA